MVHLFSLTKVCNWRYSLVTLAL